MRNTGVPHDQLILLSAEPESQFPIQTACATRLLTLLNLLLLTLPAVGQAQFLYTTNNGTVTITGYTGPSGAVVIPDTIDGLPVTHIGQYAFASSASLLGVTIPHSITSIWNSAFFLCTNLGSITVDDVNSSYSSVDGVLFNKSQTLLIQCPGARAATYAIPNSVTSIGRYAFYFCRNLIHVSIPDSVTNIGDRAFASCTGLSSVTIPKNVATIGVPAFSHCTSLSAISVDPLNSFYISSDGVLYNKGRTLLIQCPGGKTGTFAIPNGVARIEDYAFAYCTSLVGVVIPDTVNSIGLFAFYSCNSLTSLSIPNGVTSIESSTCSSCASLASVAIPHSVTGIGDLAFSYCSSLTSVSIPNGVTNIGNAAFLECTNLSNATIPYSVTWVGNFAFASCTSLSAITVDGLNSSYCSVDGVLFDKSQTRLIQYPGGKAGSYTIPKGVTSIGAGAFSRCSGLTTLTIPKSVSSIGDVALQYCTSLLGVYFQGDAPEVGLGVFQAANHVTTYYLLGTTGWGPTFAGRPTVLWDPRVKTGEPSFGVRTNRFGFTITGSSNLVLVVEASTTLANPTWIPVGTNILTDGSSYFSDPQWTNYPARFYRLRSP